MIVFQLQRKSEIKGNDHNKTPQNVKLDLALLKADTEMSERYSVTDYERLHTVRVN